MKKYLKLIILVCAAVFGLVGMFMIFAPALTQHMGKITVNINGSDVAFGGWKQQLPFSAESVKTLQASAYILAFILTLIGVVFTVLAILGKLGKIAPVVAAVCFVAGGIFFFLPAQLITPSKDYLAIPGVDAGVFRDTISENYKLGAGAIVGGLFSLLAAALSAASIFVNKK